jgi:DNA-binding response OmpR family regulator
MLDADAGNGWPRITRRLRELLWPETPVLMLTSLNDAESIRKGFDRLYDYLSKPLDATTDFAFAPALRERPEWPEISSDLTSRMLDSLGELSFFEL